MRDEPVERRYDSVITSRCLTASLSCLSSSPLAAARSLSMRRSRSDFFFADLASSKPND